MEIVTGVIVGLIVAAILGGSRLAWQHRESIGQTLRESACQHRWEPINKTGDQVVVITGDEEWCVKCGARRG